jgi:hypothetical protein
MPPEGRAIRLPVLLGLGAAALSCSAQPQVPLFDPAKGSPFPTGERPQDVVLCDIDGDGDLDVLTANSDSHDVSVLLGDGEGGFRSAAASPVPTGIASHLIVCADLTGDGHADVAVTSHESHDVVILPGDGAGGLDAAARLRITALSSGEAHNHGLLAIDVDDDGHLDIVTTNQAARSVSALHGDGEGRFAPAPGSPFPVGRMPYITAAGDVDGDGRLDLAIPNARDGNVTILRGEADGSVSAAPGSPYSVEARPYFTGLADLNGDSRLDLVTSHAEASLLSILIGDGAGGFVPATNSPVDAENRGYKVRFGDVNLDGHTDLITSGGRGVAVLLGDGQGSFTPAPGSPFATGSGSWGLAVADVDSDGDLDIVTANSDDDSVSVLLRN